MRVVRYLPENLTIYGGDIDIVFHDGFFYCMLFNPDDKLGILCSSILEGTSNFTPLPSTDGKIFQNTMRRTWIMWTMVRLLIYESHIPHATISSPSSRIVNPTIMEIREVTLWAFQRDPDSSLTLPLGRKLQGCLHQFKNFFIFT